MNQIKPWLLVSLFLIFSGCHEATLPDEMHLQTQPADYKGWVVMYRDLKAHQRMPGYFKNQTLEDNTLWVRVADLSWSSGGTRVPVVVDGVDTGYEIELAEVVYGKKVPVLKLAVYHQDTERALAYTWSAPGSQRIGINLRWLQAGLTRQQ